MPEQIDGVVTDLPSKVHPFAHPPCDYNTGGKMRPFASPMCLVMFPKVDIFNDSSQLGDHFERTASFNLLDILQASRHNLLDGPRLLQLFVLEKFTRQHNFGLLDVLLFVLG